METLSHTWQRTEGRRLRNIFKMWSMVVCGNDIGLKEADIETSYMHLLRHSLWAGRTGIMKMFHVMFHDVEVPSPIIAALIGFPCQTKLARSVCAGAFTLHTHLV